jgi:hypothetical protein
VNSADFLQLAITLTVLGVCSWVAYRAGQYQGELRAVATISHLRNHLRACSQRLERTTYELSSLREALRDARLRDPQAPTWMGGHDA